MLKVKQNEMFVTECSVGVKEMSPEEALEFMLTIKNPNNSVFQLQAIAGLCNASEFDADTYHLPLAKRKIAGDATDQPFFDFLKA